MNHPFWGTPIFGNHHLMDSILTLTLRHREEENPLRNAENMENHVINTTSGWGLLLH